MIEVHNIGARVSHEFLAAPKYEDLVVIAFLVNDKGALEELKLI